MNVGQPKPAPATARPPPLMSPAPLGLLFDFAAGHTPYRLLDSVLCSNFMQKTDVKVSGLLMRFA